MEGENEVRAILQEIMKIVESQQTRITELEATIDDLHFVHETQYDWLIHEVKSYLTMQELGRYLFRSTATELQRAFYRFCYYLPKAEAEEVLKLCPGLVAFNDAPYHTPSISDEDYSDTLFGQTIRREEGPIEL